MAMIVYDMPDFLSPSWSELMSHGVHGLESFLPVMIELLMAVTLDSSFPVALVTLRGQSLAIKSVLVHYLHFSKLKLLDIISSSTC